MNLSTLLLLAFALTVPALRAADTYAIDPAHSSITFNVRHFLAKVPGWFTTFGGTIVLDPADLTRSSVVATVDLASIDTNQEKRDAHLRTPDFFDTATHPAATFKSRTWTKTSENTYDVAGDLTLHGVTKEITLRVKYLGSAPGNRGTSLTGWEAAVLLQRVDFNIGKPERSIGDAVEVVINIEARLQKPEAQTP
jgi:polyisoprenoid-binding protein YceI